MTSLTLLSKPGCHLCDDAREIVAAVLAERSHAGVRLTELSILDDAALGKRYGEQIPVLLIDDRVHSTLRVDPARLRSALDAVAVGR